MSKSTYLGANVEVTSDTFTSFINKVNEVIGDMGTTVVTAAPVAQANATNGGMTVGNAHVQGVLSANTMTALELGGGTMSVPNTLVLATNVNPKTADINIGVDGNRVNRVFTVNSNSRNIFSNTAAILSGNVVTLTSNNATIATGNVDALTANTAEVTTANVTTMTVNTVTANVATIATGNVNNLTANVSTLKTVTANVATITTGNVATLTANNSTLTTANVATLNANNATVITGNVVTLTSNNATVTTGNVNNLTANVATIKTATANNATVTNVLTANVVNAVTLTSSGDTVVSGNLIVQGTTSLASNTAFAVNTSIADTLTVHSLASLNGNVVIGNTSSKTVSIGASLISDFIPSGNTRNLGNTTNRFATLHVNAIPGATFTANTDIRMNFPTLRMIEADNADKTWLVMVDNGAWSVRENDTGTTRLMIAANGSATGLTYLGSTVWTSGNDGSGSGLDAGLLEGQNGAYYLSAPNLTGTINDARLPSTISAKTFSGNVTVSSADPGFVANETDTNTYGRFVVSGGTTYVQAGAANTGAVSGSGSLLFSGYLGADIGTFQVRDNGAWNNIWHAGNDGSGSGLDAGLLEGQNAAFFRNGSNINAGTVADARLPTSLAGKTFTSLSTVSIGVATAAQDYFTLKPTDYAAGKPQLFMKKEAAATEWSIGLWDGVGSTGTLNLSATAVEVLGTLSATTATFTGNQIEIQGANPRIKFTDTTASSADFWAYVDSNTFYILRDNASDGSWETPHALELNSAANTAKIFGGDVWTSANDGSGSGLDAGLLEGQNAAFFRNASNLNAGTLPDARLSGAYTGITTLSQSGLHTISTTGEAIRIASTDTTGDPYLTFYKTTTRQGYIQHTDGTGNGAGFRIYNDLTDDYFYLSNVNSVDALKWYDSSTTLHNTIWHSGNLVAADINTLYGYTPASQSISITAGNGLTGGGTLAATRTVTLGTPSDITNSTTNSVTSTSHTHALGFTAAEVYTGSAVDLTDYPIGSYVFAIDPGTARNASATLYYYIAGSIRYAAGSGTAALSGTWRARGHEDQSGTRSSLFVRTA